MARRALLMVNRRARHGADLADQVTVHLQQLGIELLEVAPRKGQTLSDVVREHRERVDLVIVGGGDGTLNAAVEGLIEARLPVGILPLGTANDLARTLALPTDPVAACQVIAAGHLRSIDIGRVNGKHFFNVASIGLSVAITRNLSADVKKAWGVLAYLKTALQALYGARPFWAEIRAGGELLRVRTIQVTVGNGRYYGGGMTVSADAAIDDQRLDLYSLEVKYWWQVIWLFPRLRTGALAAAKDVRTISGPRFEILTRRRRHINTDGEITSQTPAHFDVVPQALRVFVPEAPP